jgi:hypothetical protein
MAPNNAQRLFLFSRYCKIPRTKGTRADGQVAISPGVRTERVKVPISHEFVLSRVHVTTCCKEEGVKLRKDGH